MTPTRIQISKRGRRKIVGKVGVAFAGWLYLFSGTSLGASLASASTADSPSTNTLISKVPLQTYFGSSPGVLAEYKNTLSIPVDIMTWLSIHNDLTQTLGVYSVSAKIGANATAQVGIPTLGVPDGNYSADVFATMTGIVISKDSQLKLTFSRQQDSIIQALANRNGTFASDFTDQVNRDSTVSPKIPVILYGAGLLSRLNATGFKQPGTISALGNYSISIVQSKLPEIQLSAFANYLQAAEKEPELTNFAPESVKDVNGNQIIIYKPSNVSRNDWLTAWLFYQEKITPNSVKDRGESLRVFVDETARSLFDDPYGPGYFDHRTYRVTDSQIQQVLSATYDFFFKILPDKIRVETSIQFMPFSQHFNNETALSQDIASRTGRVRALEALFEEPASTISFGAVVNGINARILQPQTMSQYLNTLVSLYDQAKINESAVYANFPSSPYFYNSFSFDDYTSLVKLIPGTPSFYDYLQARYFYWNWLNDRQNHGLYNDVKQFIQIDKVLTQSLPGWDFARFTMGYGRANSPSTDYFEGGVCIIPMLLKSAGIPSSVGGDYWIYINAPAGKAYGFELGIYGIPDKTISTLNSGTYGRVTVGPGNEFGLLSCTGGLQTDLVAGAQHLNVEPYLASASIYEILGYNPTVLPIQFPGTKIYLWP